MTIVAVVVVLSLNWSLAARENFQNFIDLKKNK